MLTEPQKKPNQTNHHVQMDPCLDQRHLVNSIDTCVARSGCGCCIHLHQEVGYKRPGSWMQYARVRVSAGELLGTFFYMSFHKNGYLQLPLAMVHHSWPMEAAGSSVDWAINYCSSHWLGMAN